MRKTELIVVTTPGLSAGFSLAGVEVLSAADGPATVRALEGLDGRTGVVLVDERLYRDVPDELRRTLHRAAELVVIPIPGPDWSDESKAQAYIVEILRRAIGYRVRLK